MNLAKKQQMPPCFPQFGHVRRYFDKSQGSPVAKILPGEYYVTQHSEMISTVLGSCISVCVYDTVARVGGMNHFMLPASGSQSEWDGTAVNKCTRYGNFAMEKLINDILCNGGRRNKLQFKIFGGGDVMSGLSNVGEQNITFVKNFLKNEGYRWEAEDVGENCPRKINFFPLSGKVKLKRMAAGECSDVIRQEEKLSKTPDTEAQTGGDLELF